MVAGAEGEGEGEGDQGDEALVNRSANDPARVVAHEPITRAARRWAR